LDEELDATPTHLKLRTGRKAIFIFCFGFPPVSLFLHHLFFFDSLSSLLPYTYIMSWQEYVDNNLIGTNQVSQAAIYGLNGAAWATSAGFQVSTPPSPPDESVTLSTLLTGTLLHHVC
jgi:hypothetical protein